jgi:hypothetical protein
VAPALASCLSPPKPPALHREPELIWMARASKTSSAQLHETATIHLSLTNVCRCTHRTTKRNQMPFQPDARLSSLPMDPHTR